MGKTSSAVKNRYNRRVYRRIAVDLPRELVDQWEETIRSKGISKTEFVRSAIQSFMNEKK